MTAGGDGFGRWYDHEDVVMASYDAHNTDCATFFNMPVKCGRWVHTRNCILLGINIWRWNPAIVRREYYPSLRRIMRSSLERLRSASHCKKFGDNSWFSLFMSTIVAGSTKGATFAPYPDLTRALNPEWKSDT